MAKDNFDLICPTKKKREKGLGFSRSSLLSTYAAGVSVVSNGLFVFAFSARTNPLSL